MSCFLRVVLPATLVLLLCAESASAQLYESIGTRAQGMAGAFVAVADDATATWWNPAGLAGGAYFSAIIEQGHVTEPADPAGHVPAAGLKSRGFAVAFPAMGLSYYRLRISEIAAISPTADSSAGRQDPGAVPPTARSLVINQFGATFDQSVGQRIVIASTLKLVRGGVTSAVAAADDPLGAAENADVAVDTRADLDIGAMVHMGYLRAGLSVRNVRQPKFGSGDTALTLKRKARAGLAVVSAAHGGFDSLIVAADADLTRSTTPFGDVRHVATGAEALLGKRHLALRGGVMANTIGEQRRTLSYGFSVAPSSGLFLDVARTSGSDASVRGWSASFRVTF